MGRENQGQKTFLEGFVGLESEKSKTIPMLLSVMILLCCALFFSTTQKVMPLMGDQITNATIVERFQNPHRYDHDPLWGDERLFLPLNLGVFAFYGISRVAPLEEAIPVAMTIILSLYLMAGFTVFYKLSHSPSLALSLSLLSCLPIEMPAYTFWGIAYSPSFVSRTIFLPLVPLFFYHFLRILDGPTVRKCVIFYLLLGLAALVHQISSLYLFLSFLLCLFLAHPRLVKMHVVSSISWLLAVSPSIIYSLYQYDFGNRASYPPLLLQRWIESVFFWAFNPVLGRAIVEYITGNPHHIAILVLVPLLFRRNQHVRHLAKTTLAVIIASVSTYGVQYFLWKCLNIPFKFAEVLRGLRFIPFLVFMAVAVIWQDLIAYFHRVQLRSLICPVSITFLIFSVYIFAFNYHAHSPQLLGHTCPDPMFGVIQQLPPSALIATDLGVRQQSQSGSFTVTEALLHLRYCGKRPVYVMLRDGAIAFYNGRDHFIRWVNRLNYTVDFFITLNPKSLGQLKRDGVTHLCVKGELPPSSLWSEIHRSAHYCLYQLEGD